MPATKEVRPEPIKYVTEQGFTVFIISWKNPGLDDRDLGMAEYRTLRAYFGCVELGDFPQIVNEGI